MNQKLSLIAVTALRDATQVAFDPLPTFASAKAGFVSNVSELMRFLLCATLWASHQDSLRVKVVTCLEYCQNSHDHARRNH